MSFASAFPFAKVKPLKQLLLMQDTKDLSRDFDARNMAIKGN